VPFARLQTVLHRKIRPYIAGNKQDEMTERKIGDAVSEICLNARNAKDFAF
jgi:hypothetical protein